jgi:hypothetical protein
VQFVLFAARSLPISRVIIRLHLTPYVASRARCAKATTLLVFTYQRMKQLAAASDAMVLLPASHAFGCVSSIVHKGNDTIGAHVHTQEASGLHRAASDAMVQTPGVQLGEL